MNNRLKQFLAAENITQAQFADNINVVRASVSHVLSGRNNPSFDFIKAMMSKYPRLNIDWLMFGKGKMYKDSEPVGDDLLFPIIEPDIDLRVPDIVTEDKPTASEQTSNAMDTSIDIVQSIAKQRKVSKIIILFDDGTYQEM